MNKEAIDKIAPKWRARLGDSFKTPDDFRKALKKGGYKINDGLADSMLSHPDFKQSLIDADRDQVYDLIVLTTVQLIDKGTQVEVFNKADEVGLEKCPPWIGPWVRLHRYEGWREADFNIAMEPIVVPPTYPTLVGFPSIFVVGSRITGFVVDEIGISADRTFFRELSATHNLYNCSCWPTTRWVFVRPVSK